MRLLSAAALWWLLLSAPIIFFYLLKLKRKRRPVPSVFLWQRALEELEANAPFRRLRRNLLLLVQLLALIALVLALARPLVATRALAAGSTVIIIDTTASMNSRDENGDSRLARAKSIALQLVDGLNGDERAAIVESSSRVIVRGGLTSDAATLRNSLATIEGTDAAGDIDEAVRFAKELVAAERNATVIVISDGGPPPSASPAKPTPTTTAHSDGSVRFIRVGSRSDNVGIVAMNVRTSALGAERELFGLITNFSDRERSFPVEMRVEGTLVDARTVAIAPHDQYSIVLHPSRQLAGLAELKLRIEDDLSSDDIAYTVLPDIRRIRAGVSSNNQFLLRALAVNPALDLRRVTASDAASEFDCLVIESGDAAAAITSGLPLIIINPSAGHGMFETGNEIDKPEVTSVESSHPINQFLSYADVHVELSKSMNVPSWLKPIVSSSAGGLIWAGDDGSRRVVVVGFDLQKSDLPLKVEFPIFLANTIDWLISRESQSGERAVRVGQPVNLSCPAGETRITLPDGESQQIAAQNGSVIFADDSQAGLYQVQDSAPFGASLLNQTESDNAPRDAITIGRGEVRGEVETFRSEREVWRWAALIAIVLLSIEWWLYHRRIV